MAVRALPGGGVRFTVRLTPKGGRDAIDGWTTTADGERCLKARVSAVPENGKANQALALLLAKALGVPRSSVLIAGGEKARLKTIEVSGDAGALTATLEAFGDAK